MANAVFLVNQLRRKSRDRAQLGKLVEVGIEGRSLAAFPANFEIESDERDQRVRANGVVCTGQKPGQVNGLARLIFLPGLFITIGNFPKPAPGQRHPVGGIGRHGGLRHERRLELRHRRRVRLRHGRRVGLRLDHRVLQRLCRGPVAVPPRQLSYSKFAAWLKGRGFQFCVPGRRVEM